MFEIKTKGKAFLKKLDPEDINVSEAISTIYHNEDNFMIFMNWNGFTLPMDGISFSQIYNDVTLMLELVQSDEKEFSINFLDTGLTAVWSFTTEDNFINVEAEWIDIASYGNENTTVEELEKVSNIITINKSDFINEWNSLLKIIKDDLISAGYNDSLEGFEYLNTLD